MATAPHGMKIHGGVQMAGTAAMENLELEEVAIDPTNPGLGRLWVNTVDKRVKYVTSLTDQGIPIVESVASSGDVANLLALINQKANTATLARSATIDATNASNLNTGTLPPARLPALTGDASTVAGTAALTLATVATPGTATKLTFDAKGRVTAGTILAPSDIPNLDYSKITSGKPTTLAGFGITDAVAANVAVVAKTGTKISYDAKGLVTGSTILSASDIPVLDWSKITTGKPTTITGYGLTDAQPLNAKLTALSNLATSGISVHTDANTVAARSIVGTNAQLVVTNGDGVAGNPTIALAPNPVMPGNGFMVVPAGTDAQRGVPVIGGIRYNYTNDQFEGNSPAGWVAFAGNNLITGIYTGLVAQMSGTTILNSTSAVQPSANDGTLLLSKTIVPSRLTSYFIIDLDGFVDAGTTNAMINVAVFRNGIFVGLSSIFIKTAGQPNPFAMKIVESPNTTQPVTYTVRIGLQNAGTWYLGRTSSNTFGGVNPSGWSITQVF